MDCTKALIIKDATFLEISIVEKHESSQEKIYSKDLSNCGPWKIEMNLANCYHRRRRV